MIEVMIEVRNESVQQAACGTTPGRSTDIACFLPPQIDCREERTRRRCHNDRVAPSGVGGAAARTEGGTAVPTLATGGCRVFQGMIKYSKDQANSLTTDVGPS